MSNDRLFDHVLGVIRKQSPSFQPGEIVDQTSLTSVVLELLQDVEVELLMQVPAPIQYTASYRKSKRQLPPYQQGDHVFVRLHVDGLLYLMADECQEMMRGAIEGVHFKFI